MPPTMLCRRRAAPPRSQYVSQPALDHSQCHLDPRAKGKGMMMVTVLMTVTSCDGRWSSASGPWTPWLCGLCLARASRAGSMPPTVVCRRRAAPPRSRDATQLRTITVDPMLTPRIQSKGMMMVTVLMMVTSCDGRWPSASVWPVDPLVVILCRLCAASGCGGRAIGLRPCCVGGVLPPPHSRDVTQPVLGYSQSYLDPRIKGKELMERLMMT
jgi:hypothetical protein